MTIISYNLIVQSIEDIKVIESIEGIEAEKSTYSNDLQVKT